MAELNLKELIKNLIRSLMPLFLRKWLSIWISRQMWVGCGRRNWWSLELIRDFAEKDINEYHKFLRSNHIGFTKTDDADGSS